MQHNNATSSGFSAGMRTEAASLADSLARLQRQTDNMAVTEGGDPTTPSLQNFRALRASWTDLTRSVAHYRTTAMTDELARLW